MTNEETIKQFEKMFDLDSSSNENDQAEEYGHSTESEESFEELAKEVQEDIKEMPDKGSSIKKEDPHDIIIDVGSRKAKQQEVIPEVEETFGIDGDFDELVVDEEFINFAQQEKEKKDDDEGEKGDGEGEEDEIGIFADGEKNIKWNLKSPADMYGGFYREKRKFLTKYMVGGEIEYSRWTKELEEAQVDVVTEVFDQRVIIKQMEEIQQYRDRTKYIGVRVNNQYYLFDRFIVLLRGALAKIQYLKPVLKQDGLILEHMGDIELYMQRLKALHNSVLITEKNLAASYEMLSRKVTICMELPPAERYDKKDAYRSRFTSIEKEGEREDLKDYDVLPENAKAGAKGNKIGNVEWGEI